MIVVVYTGGAGGNLVAALIDSRDYQFDNWHYMLPTTTQRGIWNRSAPHWDITQSDEERYSLMDIDFERSSNEYLSIASHQSRYHISRKHDYIAIDSTEPKIAEWATSRFSKNINLPPTHSVFDTNKKILRTTEALTHTKKIIKLSDIVNGNLINVLSNYVDGPLNTKLYEQWLTANV